MEKRRVKYSKISSWKRFYSTPRMAPSGLIIIFGNRGSGKSATIAKRYLKWLKNETHIYKNFYSNIEFNVSHEGSRYLDLEKHKFTDYIIDNELTRKYRAFTRDSITEFYIEPNSIVCLDELGIIANSRDFANFPKEFIHMIKILRKLGILLIANSQNYDIDKQLRLGASELRLQKKIGNLSYSRKINKFIDIAENNVSAESQIVDKIEFASILEKNAIQLTFIPFYSSMYDTYK